MDNHGKRALFLERRAALAAAGETARGRIALLLDEGSFLETGVFVTQRPTEFGAQGVSCAAEGVITGWGTVDGNPVCVFSQDATAAGGAVSEMHAKKILSLYAYACKTGVPVVGIFDSKGARVAEGVDALNGYAAMTAAAVRAKGHIPQIAVIAGICGGAAALFAACFDFVVAVNGGELFMTPPAVRSGDAAAATGASFTAANDAEAAGFVRALLAMLPANAGGEKNFKVTADDINRLADIAAMEDGNPRAVLSQIADEGSYLEIGADTAASVFTAFARFDGETAGIVGAWGTVDADAAAKAADFVALCDLYHISVLTIVNADTFAQTAAFEKDGITAAAGLAAAYAGADTAMVTLYTGKAVGSIYVAFGARGLGCDIAMAWPQAEISATSAAAAVELLCTDALKAAEDPIATRAELEAQFAETAASPYEAAKRGYVDSIIDPAETRQAIVYALGLLSAKETEGM